jgi:hypothetical protein
MNELFVSSLSALLALPGDRLMRARIPRERVEQLTAVICSEFRPLLPRLVEELSPARAAERTADYEALEPRAQVYFAADLAVEEPWTAAQKARRAELAARVREHDERLSGWAVRLFEQDEEARAVVEDILRGKGIRDDAEDTIRLVALLRRHWDAVVGKVPATEAELAEADAEAQELVQILDAMEGAAPGSPRDLRRRAFTWWFQAYTEIFLLGRYLLRHDVVAAERFPAVPAERAALVAGGRV